MKTNKDKPQGGIKSLWQNKRAVVFDFLKYVLVGAIATAVEYGIFTLLIFALGKPYYEIATVVGYIVSTFFNWLFGRIILFKTSNKPLFKEILEIYLASVAGLLMNMGIMWLFVDLAGINPFISKIIATAVVFLWNFIARKLIIYKK